MGVINMGVAFQPYKPLDDYVHIGYRIHHMMRCLLLRPLAKEEDYNEFLKKGMDYDDDGAEAILTDILEDIKGKADKDVIFGISEFVDHSDCDGEFGNESCEYIYKAFDWALKIYKENPSLKGDSPPAYFETMKRLRDVFKKAYEENGLVMLF
jgi:hypothetical protein